MPRSALESGAVDHCLSVAGIAAALSTLVGDPVGDDGGPMPDDLEIESKIAAFEQMVRPFGLIEMVRTGEIAVSRGRGST